MSVHFRFIDVAEGMPLFAWGAGNHGQLANGLDDHRAPAAVPIEGHIQGLAAGGSHSLIVRPFTRHLCIPLYFAFSLTITIHLDRKRRAIQLWKQ